MRSFNRASSREADIRAGTGNGFRLAGARAQKTGIPSAGMTRIRFDGCFSAAQAAPLAITRNLA